MAGNTEKGAQNGKKKKKKLGKRMRRDGLVVGPSLKKKKKTKSEEEKQVPRTLENTREFDETMVSPDDEEVLQDELHDEFAEHFSGKSEPKVIITTTRKPSLRMKKFAASLTAVVGADNADYYKRKDATIKEIMEGGIERGYTDVVVIAESSKQFRILYTAAHPHLPPLSLSLSLSISSLFLPPSLSPPSLLLSTVHGFLDCVQTL